MNWQDVATALWLADTDTERAVADGLYRAKMRSQLFGSEATLITEHETVTVDEYHAPVVVRATGLDRAAYTDEAIRDARDGPTEGQIRSNAAGDGVEQFRQGIWQEVDPVDLFKHQRGLIEAQRGEPDPTPEVDPAVLPPVVHPVPDPETAYRHEVLLQQRRGGSAQNSAVRPLSGPLPAQDSPVVGSDGTPPAADTQALSDGSVKVQPLGGVGACAATTPDGPCTLTLGHPIGPMFPGHNGHLHTGD